MAKFDRIHGKDIKFFCKSKDDVETDEPQQRMFRDSLEQRPPSQSIFLGRNLYEFAHISVDDKHWLFDAMERDEHFFEILNISINKSTLAADELQSLCRVKPYFDMDFACVKAEHDFSALRDSCVDLIKDSFREAFDIVLDESAFVILDKCRRDKFSYHFVVNGFCFENFQDHKLFFEQVFTRLLKNEKFKLIHEVALDSSVYNKDKSFGLVNQSKPAKTPFFAGK